MWFIKEIRVRFSSVDDFQAPRASAVSPDMAVQTVRNGDFSTGGFRHWTTFTTESGTLGYPNLPKITSFDVNGSGAQNAAEFQVGQVGDVGTEEGGGIMQAITTTAGALDFSADIAAFASKQVNLEGGTFSVLLDGVTEDTVVIGAMAKHTIQRGQLAFDVSVTAGSHTLEILITRDFTDGKRRGNTPFEYVTNISATQDQPASRPPLAGVHAFAAAAAGLGAGAGSTGLSVASHSAHPAMIAAPHGVAA